MNPHTTDRQYELDWLRCGAILVVFIYHGSRFFNLGNWHVKNINTYVWVEIWNGFATLWMMPLFFIISGAGLYHALRQQTGFKSFYSKKFLRLMVPVLVATVTHGALQVYLERITHHQYAGSFISFLPHYFSGLYLRIGGEGNFAFHGMHLWYLLFLFFYTLLCYPLMTWLAGNGKGVLKRITHGAANPWLLYLFFASPLLLLEWLVPPALLSVGNGGWGFLFYLWFLISGFLIASGSRLSRRIKHQRHLSLTLAAIFTLLYLYNTFSPSGALLPAPMGAIVSGAGRYLAAFCWLLSILGYAMQHLAFNRPGLRHLNEGVLPFYILHQTVLLCVGYFVMAWTVHDIVKGTAVLFLSFFLILGIYLFFILKSDLLRFLFGMKTSRLVFRPFQKPAALTALHLGYAGLIFFAVSNWTGAAGRPQSLSPLRFEPGKDILLDSRSVSHISPIGAKLIPDHTAANGRAVSFFSGDAQSPLPDPAVYVEMKFDAPAGCYMVWIRGLCPKEGADTDSVWLQKDREIGTKTGVMLGNWNDISPAKTWSWAGNAEKSVGIILKYGGEHRLLVQPRQTPHRIDQIWLSRFQYTLPVFPAPLDKIFNTAADGLLFPVVGPLHRFFPAGI